MNDKTTMPATKGTIHFVTLLEKKLNSIPIPLKIKIKNIEPTAPATTLATATPVYEYNGVNIATSSICIITISNVPKKLYFCLL